MQRDPRAYLWDVRESAIAIQGFIAGMDADAYAASDLVQAGVERKFEVIGEAWPSWMPRWLRAYPSCRRSWPFATN